MASVRTVGFYDAEASVSITDASGFCSSWADLKNPANAVTQGTSAARPQIVAAHALTGRPVLQFDGTDDYLRLTGVPYPTSGNLSILVVGVQDALPADTTARYIATTGQSTSNGLMLRRAVSGGVNRFQTTTGNGAGGSNNSSLVAVDFSNRFYAIGRWNSTTQTGKLNGVSSVPNTATMTGDTTRWSIGCTAASTPAGFWKGALSALIYVVGQMSTEDETNFATWATMRLGM